MKVSLEIGEESLALLVPALVEAAKREGLLIQKSENSDPLTIDEAARRSGLSTSQVRKMVTDGIFDRVPLVGRVLITAESFDHWKKGGAK